MEITKEIRSIHDKMIKKFTSEAKIQDGVENHVSATLMSVGFARGLEAMGVSRKDAEAMVCELATTYKE